MCTTSLIWIPDCAYVPQVLAGFVLGPPVLNIIPYP
jgi:hypothetical protein